MSIYFLNTAGSNTAPYDTPAKGANKLTTIKSYGAGDGETAYDIRVVNNGPDDVNIVDTSLYPWGEGTDTASESFRLTSHDTKNPGIITAYNHGGTGLTFYSTQSLTSVEITDLIFVPDPEDSGNIELINILGVNGIDNVSIKRNQFKINSELIDSSSNSAPILRLINPTAGGTIEITDNLFESVKDPAAIYSENLNGANVVIRNNTFIREVASHASISIDYGDWTGSAIKDNIIYAKGVIPTSAGIYAGTNISALGDNVIDYNIIYGGTLYDLNGKGNPGPNSLNTDPLFKETNLYTLQSVSPAVNAGSSGRNIGWDLINEWVYTGKIGIFKAKSPVSRPGSKLKDADNGRGLEYGINKSYNPSRDQSIVKNKPFNGYRAPNLR